MYFVISQSNVLCGDENGRTWLAVLRPRYRHPKDYRIQRS